VCNAGKCAVPCCNGFHWECWSYCGRPSGSKGNCCGRGLLMEKTLATIDARSQFAEGVGGRSEGWDTYHPAVVPQRYDTGSSNTAHQPTWHCGRVSTWNVSNCLTNRQTSCIEHNPSWEDNSCWASQESPLESNWTSKLQEWEKLHKKFVLFSSDYSYY
jgi:hypothetical protein